MCAPLLFYLQEYWWVFRTTSYFNTDFTEDSFIDMALNPM